MPRYAKRRDTNESALLAVVRRCGCYWVHEGPFDGWVWNPKVGGEWAPVEIKRADKEGWKDEFTPSQQKLLAEFRDRRIRLYVWRTETDVLRDLGRA